MIRNRCYNSIILGIIWGILWASPVFAAHTVVDYDATETKTNEQINSQETTAVIRYDSKEVLLPLVPNPDIVKFVGEGYDYVVSTENGLVRYSFDGDKMIQNTAEPQVPSTNPIAIGINYGTPDRIVVNQTKDRKFNINYYGYDGDGYVENPYLSATGLESSLSITYIEGADALVNVSRKNLEHYTSSGGALALSQKIDVKNPIAVASQKGYNIALLTQEGIQQYGYDGTNMVDIPALAVSFEQEKIQSKTFRGVGISNGNVFALDETQVYGFSYDDATGKLKHSEALSLANSLVKPKAMAVDPETYNMVILDETTAGNFTARFFMYDSTQWLENTALNAAVSHLNGKLDYAPEGTLVFNPIETPSPGGDRIRVRAYAIVPENTKITAYVANETQLVNGKTEPKWQPAWAITHEAGKGISVRKRIPLVSDYQWADYGTVDQVYPSYNEKPTAPTFDLTQYQSGTVIKTDYDYLNDLWIQLPNKTTKGYVKILLESLDGKDSPKLVVPNATNPIAGQSDTKAVQIEVATKPGNIVVDVGNGLTEEDKTDFLNQFGFPPKAGWVYTTTPPVSWKDEATGEAVKDQAAYQMVVLGVQTDGSRTVVLDTGKQLGALGETRIPTSYDPSIKGCLFASGTYHFEALVRIWTASGDVSDYSNVKSFHVLAMERPRVSALVDPPESYAVIPQKNDPSTHAMVRPGASGGLLPQIKGGSAVTLTLDTVGPLSRAPGGSKKIGNLKLYLGGTVYHGIHTLGETNLRAMTSSGTNNEISVTFYTDAPLDKSPPGSLIQGSFISEGFDGVGTIFKAPTFAEGYCIVSGSNDENWRVLMKGSRKQ